jgi:hypothetical protein
MERDPFMFEDSGLRRIDLSNVEEMAYSLAEVARYLDEDEFDVYGELYDELQMVAENTLARKVCGVHAAYCIGCDSTDLQVGEPVDSYGANFIGLFSRVSIIYAPNEAFLLPDINTQESLVLSALFYPVEPEELPYDTGDRFNGFVSSVYPCVAVPLIGVPLIVEQLPGKID